MGSLEQAVADDEAGLPSGPQSAAQLFDWPKWIVEALCLPSQHSGAEQRFRRLLHFFDNGILSSSYFSGWDSQEDALDCLRIAFEGFSGHGVRGFLWLSSCDNKKLCQDILMEKSRINMKGARDELHNQQDNIE